MSPERGFHQDKIGSMTEMDSMRPVALGVAGGTGSGKTTVAQAILRSVGPGRIASLAQDSYYKDLEWSSDEELLRHNFDHPEAVDTDLLVNHLLALKAGQAVEVPIYDFVAHVRTERSERVESRPVILLEGILLLAEPRIRSCSTSRSMSIPMRMSV